MCGACGTPVSGWTERIAPLGAGGAERRARALSVLLRATGSAAARRVRVSPWHGGALRLHGPSGWQFVPSLSAGVSELTRRHGPLVPVDALSESPDPVSLGFPPTPEETAVWCAAVMASGLPKHATITLTTALSEILLSEGEVQVTPTEQTSPTLRTHRGAAELSTHWRQRCGRPGEGPP